MSGYWTEKFGTILWHAHIQDQYEEISGKKKCVLTCKQIKHLKEKKLAYFSLMNGDINWFQAEITKVFVIFTYSFLLTPGVATCRLKAELVSVKQ